MINPGDGRMNKLEKMNDAELLKLIRQGQTEAGEIIFRRYYSTLVGISRKYLKCQHDAEDIAQEVFLRVLGMNKISRFRGDSSLRTWLIRIAINQCYSKQRKRTEKLLRDDPQHLPPVLPAADPDPEETAMRSETKQYLRLAIWKLPKKYQLAMALFYQEQENYRSIAQKLRQSVGSIGVCLKRGRVMLHRRLAYRGVWA